MEVWRRMSFDHPDFHHRLLATGLCEVLTTRQLNYAVANSHRTASSTNSRVVLPTNHELLRRLPNRKILTNRAAMKLVGTRK